VSQTFKMLDAARVPHTTGEQH
jgi:hypothetical protein